MTRIGFETRHALFAFSTKVYDEMTEALYVICPWASYSRGQTG